MPTTPTSEGMSLQPRDITLLRGLFESRLMTLDHAAALHFDGKREMAKKRAQKLKAAGLLAERRRHSSEPSVLHLSGDGLALLQERGLLSSYPKLSRQALLKRAQVSDLTLRHELEVMSVKAALVSKVKKTDRFTVAEFSTWPALHEFSVRASVIDPTRSGEIVVKPDGFIRIHETEPEDHVSEYSFFLEIDRGTETLQTLVNKAVGYRDFYRRGGFAERCGAPRSEFEKFPFRVLLVLHSHERLENVARAFLAGRTPIRRIVWLATFGEVIADSLGAIWHVPQELANVQKHPAPKSLLD